MNLKVFEDYESEVRSYIRSFPTVFTTAKGYKMQSEDGQEYLDFFAGAGVLNYGHNPSELTAALVDYIQSGGIAHSLDMATSAKRDFILAFEEKILKPRGLNYKIQFPGPTGTNAVETALKIARKYTGRETMISFTNAFHGMTLGALAVTGNSFKRSGAGIPLAHTNSMPYDGYLGNDMDTIEYLETFLDDGSSGIDLPAAIVVESIQGEGGVNVASIEWMQRLAALAKHYKIPLILDDIQAGCGRTGTFFSFERAGIKPDIVCLSKSLSGIGQPFALTLLSPEMDEWEPGEHNGTFRGNNYAFVTATKSIELFWQDDELTKHVDHLGNLTRTKMQEIVDQYPKTKATVRGVGMLNGIDFPAADVAKKVCQAAFKRGLIMETSGPAGNVAKVMPPLTIDEEGLLKGLDILAEAVAAVMEEIGDAANVPDPLPSQTSSADATGSELRAS